MSSRHPSSNPSQNDGNSSRSTDREPTWVSARQVGAAVLDWAARSVPGAQWSSLLCLGGSRTGAVVHDAVSDSVMVDVLAADARTRHGPLRVLAKQRRAPFGGTNEDADPMGLYLRDVADPGRFVLFCRALAATSPEVRTLAYLPIGRRDAVLVLASSVPGALDEAHAARSHIAASIRTLLDAADEMRGHGPAVRSRADPRRATDPGEGGRRIC